MNGLKKNKISDVLFTIGIVEMIVCFVFGIVFGQSFSSDFNFPIALYWWIGGFVSGMLFVGFSEVINLLQKLVDNKKAPTSDTIKYDSQEDIYSVLISPSNEKEFEGFLKFEYDKLLLIKKVKSTTSYYEQPFSSFKLTQIINFEIVENDQTRINIEYRGINFKNDVSIKFENASECQDIMTYLGKIKANE